MLKIHYRSHNSWMIYKLDIAFHLKFEQALLICFFRLRLIFFFPEQTCNFFHFDGAKDYSILFTVQNNFHKLHHFAFAKNLILYPNKLHLLILIWHSRDGNAIWNTAKHNIKFMKHMWEVEMKSWKKWWLLKRFGKK